MTEAFQLLTLVEFVLLHVVVLGENLELVLLLPDLGVKVVQFVAQGVGHLLVVTAAERKRVRSERERRCTSLMMEPS